MTAAESPESTLAAVLAELIERCRKSEASLMTLAEDRDPTTHDCYRLRGKRAGVALVRGYIDESARHLRLHGPAAAILAATPTAAMEVCGCCEDGCIHGTVTPCPHCRGRLLVPATPTAAHVEADGLPAHQDYDEPCTHGAAYAAVQTHTRTATEQGPDFCEECSTAVSEWVQWPCPRADPAARVAELEAALAAAEARLAEAWDQGRAAERRDWELTFDITTPDEDRQPWANPYRR